MRKANIKYTLTKVKQAKRKHFTEPKTREDRGKKKKSQLELKKKKRQKSQQTTVVR